jgi:molybdopterin/thiamine biosynthesis adenylyltransferase
MGNDTYLEIQGLIRGKSRTIKDPAGRTVKVLEDIHSEEIADTCQCSVLEVYMEAMRRGILPYRYLRNRDSISIEEQLKLAESQVAVIGAGGLGGEVILLLARIGIGRLIVVDSDAFDETNLNRQALSSRLSLGRSKAEEAAVMVHSINSGVGVTPYQVRIDSTNARKMLAGSDVVVDALDNVPDRLMLESEAKRLGIPLVHGALAGFGGQLMTIFPDDIGLKLLYREGMKRVDPKSPEAILGVPTVTPALIGSLEVMEVLKIILKRGTVFRNTMVYVDLDIGELNRFTFESGDSVHEIPEHE